MSTATRVAPYTQGTGPDLAPRDISRYKWEVRERVCGCLEGMEGSEGERRQAVEVFV